MVHRSTPSTQFLWSGSLLLAIPGKVSPLVAIFALYHWSPLRIILDPGVVIIVIIIPFVSLLVISVAAGQCSILLTIGSRCGGLLLRKQHLLIPGPQIVGTFFGGMSHNLADVAKGFLRTRTFGPASLQFVHHTASALVLLEHPLVALNSFIILWRSFCKACTFLLDSSSLLSAADSSSEDFVFLEVLHSLSGSIARLYALSYDVGGTIFIFLQREVFSPSTNHRFFSSLIGADSIFPLSSFSRRP